MYLPPPSSQATARYHFILFDFLWTLMSPIFSLWLRGSFSVDNNFFYNYGFPIVLYTFLSFISSNVVLFIIGAQERVRHFSARDALIIVIGIIFSVALTIALTFALTRLEGIPRTVPIINGLLLTFGLLLYRLIIKNYNEISHLKSTNPLNNNLNAVSKRIILIGLDPFSISAIRLLQRQRPQSVQIVAVFGLKQRNIEKKISNIRIISSLDYLDSIIAEYIIHGVNVDEIWISDSSNHLNDNIAYQISFVASKRKLTVKMLSDALNLKHSNNWLERGNVSNADEKIVVNSNYMSVKRILDIVCAIFLLIVLMPIVFATLIIVYLDIGLPLLFWQERIGQYNNNFRLYKIRTLGHLVDKKGNIIQDQDRYTKIGNFIRRVRLDEYPQLLNVIIGDMSGIGPRPLLPRDQPKHNTTRLLVRPGITGWAQVNGGELLNPEEKNALDCWYVHNMSFWLDIKIFCKSVIVLIKGVKRCEVSLLQALKHMKTSVE